MSDGGPRVSVVVPVLNEEENLPLLLPRLLATLEELGEPFEVVVVDDGSTDGTLRLLREEEARSPALRVVSFARNFGQHAAVMAGFEASRGEWIVTIDADLQNPPEEIPKLVEEFRKGHDLVNTYRGGRQDSLFRRLASRWNGAILRRWSGIPLRDFGCMLRGYHRRVVQPMLGRTEFRTFIPALGSLHARRPVEIEVAHAPRERGHSKYSVRKLLSLQLDLMASFSTAPLRALFVVGWFVALFGIGFGLLLIVLRLTLGATWAAQGVFTVLAVLFIFIGAQFFAFGLLGEYIGRIYQEVRTRPRYLLREEPDDAADRHRDIPGDEPDPTRAEHGRAPGRPPEPGERTT